MGASSSRISATSSDHDGDRTEFIGSQVGGRSIINYSYTDMPWKLLAFDIKYFFTFAWALPWILWPIRPCDGGHFDELAPTLDNIKCISIHAVLVILQLACIILLPVGLILPGYVFLLVIGVFSLINWLLCRSLNGKTLTYESDPKYAPALEQHQHEQWIFLNGVAAGETWLKSNIDRLALTFKRPILGIHNRTNGIVFDVVECLIQRNFGYATSDVRLAYKIVKDKLYNPQYSKVIFILHSQGGIEGGLVLDWLLQELSHDLLAKLEVYTFGNAANHFNNPNRHNEYHGEHKHHNLTANPSEMTDSSNGVKAPPPVRQLSNASGCSFRSVDRPQSSTFTAEIVKPSMRRLSTIFTHKRAIGHIEHYAHTTDFVALWGILHFVTNQRASPEMPRFIGRVFKRVSSRGGHQFCQHYLNGMFPMCKNEDGEFTGCADSNDFMDSVVEIAKEGTEQQDMHEDVEKSWAMLELAGKPDSEIPLEVAVHGSDAWSLHGSIRGRFRGDEPGLFDGRVKVKHLSRLWQYRNGGSPPVLPNGVYGESTA